MSFRNNVFINCPFDDEYKELLRVLLFTVLYLGYKPMISLMQSSSDVRINQIKSYIKNSRFGIHDLSRCKAMMPGELPRFNMPFELGLDMGCHEFGNEVLKTKRILILETERFHYQKVLSDIAGQDIENHDGDLRTLALKVRNRFSSLRTRKSYPGITEIWLAYNIFIADFEGKAKNAYVHHNDNEVPVKEFIKLVRQWISSTESLRFANLESSHS